MSDQPSQASREAFQAGIDDALASGGARARVAADAEITQTLLEVRREMAELRAASRTPVPASQIKSVRLRLAESDLLSGIVDSPRTSLIGVFVMLAGIAKYLDPSILGEALHLIEQQGDAGAFGLIVGGLSMLLGKYGAAQQPPADGSIEPAQQGGGVVFGSR